MQPSDLDRLLELVLDPRASIREVIRKLDAPVQRTVFAAAIAHSITPARLGRILAIDDAEEAKRLYDELRRLHFVSGDRQPALTRAARAEVREMLAAEHGAELAELARRAEAQEEGWKALHHRLLFDAASVPEHLERLAPALGRELPNDLLVIADELAADARSHAQEMGPHGESVASLLDAVAASRDGRFEEARTALAAIEGAGAAPWLTAAAERLAAALPAERGRRVALVADFTGGDASGTARMLEEHGFEVRRVAAPADVIGAVGALEPVLSPGARVVVWLRAQGTVSMGSAGLGAEIAPGLGVAALAAALGALPALQVLLVADGSFAGPLPFRRVRGGRTVVFREDFTRAIETPSREVLSTHGGWPAFAEAVEAALADPRVLTSAELEARLVPPEGAAVVRWSLGGTETGAFVVAAEAPEDLPAAPPIDRDHNPFCALDSYTKEDHEDFLGREEETRRLLAFIATHPFTFVVGPSGSGKSSLVRAGLVPALPMEDYAPEIVVRPGGNAPNALRLALAGEDSIDESRDPYAALVEAAEKSAPRRTVVVIDQLEELFTLTSDAAQRAAFGEGLASALTRAPSLRIVATLRRDFVAPAREILRRHVDLGRFELLPMTVEQLRAAIRGAAIRNGLHFDPPALIDRMAEDASAERGGAAMLSYTLSALYEELADRHAQAGPGALPRTFRLEDYELRGGVSGALRSAAEALLARHDDKHQATIRRVMLRLVTLAGGSPTRRVVKKSELLGDEKMEVGSLLSRITASAQITPKEEAIYREERERTEAILDELAEAHLVRLNDNATYELTHEVLIHAWLRLRDWINDDRSYQLQSAIRAAMLGRGGWFIDARTDEAIKLAERDPLWLNKAELAFLRTSKGKQDRVTQAGYLGCLSIIGLVVGIVFAVRSCTRSEDERSDSKQNEVRALASASASFEQERRAQAARYAALAKAELAKEAPEIAGLLAVEATVLAPGEAARLAGLMRHLPIARVDLPKALHVALDAQGKVLVAASTQKLVFARVPGGEQLAAHELDGGAYGITFDAEGDRVAIVDQGTLRLFTAQGKALPIGDVGPVRAASFDAAGRLLTVSFELGVRRWQLEPTFALEGELAPGSARCSGGPEKSYDELCWISASADRRRLALSSGSTVSVVASEDALAAVATCGVSGAQDMLLHRMSGDGALVVGVANTVDPAGTNSGISSFALRPASDGCASVRLKGDGEVLGIPAVTGPLADGSYLATAQLSDETTCWRVSQPFPEEVRPWARLRRSARYFEVASDDKRPRVLMAFSPDGAWLLSGAYLWRRTGDDWSEASFRSPHAFVPSPPDDYGSLFSWAVSWSEDSSTVAVVSGADRVAVYRPAAPLRDDFVKEACRRIGRSVTAEERKKYDLPEEALTRCGP